MGRLLNKIKEPNDIVKILMNEMQYEKRERKILG